MLNSYELAKKRKNVYIKSMYERALMQGRSFTVNDVTYSFVGSTDVLTGLNLALQACKLQQNTIARISDSNNFYVISLEDLESLIARIIIWRDTIWNQKADLYIQLDAIKQDDYPTVDDAAAAIETLVWVEEEE